MGSYLIHPGHAKRIWDIVEHYTKLTGLCICQCEAGISRSAGVSAALASVYQGYEAEQSIFKDRRYLPNRLVYRTVHRVAYQHGLL